MNPFFFFKKKIKTLFILLYYVRNKRILKATTVHETSSFCKSSKYGVHHSWPTDIEPGLKNAEINVSKKVIYHHTLF